MAILSVHIDNSATFFPAAYLIQQKKDTVGRGFLLPILSREPYIVCPYVSQILCMLFVLPCFLGWMCHHAKSNVLFYLMILCT